MQRFLDSVSVAGTKKTSEGFLVADAFAVRTGVQIYAGVEVGRPDLQAVRVYRPESEVFSADTLRSFSHVPVTNDHPTVPVTSENWKDLAIGEASTDVLRDGHRMRIPLVLKDAASIAEVEAGKRELSAGYSCDLAFEAGITADGMEYDAVQRNIRANHIAVVRRGRAGSEFRIGDSAASWGAAPVLDHQRELPMTTKKIVFDGITIEVTDQAAEAIAKLTQRLSDSTAALDTLKGEHTAQLATKDAEIGTLTAQLADAKKAVPDGATLDKLVADRVALIDAAKHVAKDLKVEGLSDADIRRAAVTAKYGEAVTKDASDDMIAGMFKVAAADAKVDPVRQSLQAADNRAPLTNDHGQSEYENNLKNRWKTAGAA